MTFCCIVSDYFWCLCSLPLNQTPSRPPAHPPAPRSTNIFYSEQQQTIQLFSCWITHSNMNVLHLHLLYTVHKRMSPEFLLYIWRRFLHLYGAQYTCYTFLWIHILHYMILHLFLTYFIFWSWARIWNNIFHVLISWVSVVALQYWKQYFFTLWIIHFDLRNVHVETVIFPFSMIDHLYLALVDSQVCLLLHQPSIPMAIMASLKFHPI